MPLTLAEITEREEGLRSEIAERERLLAAYQVLREDVGNTSRSAPSLQPQQDTVTSQAPPQPPETPAPVPVHSARKMNPELKAMPSGWGNAGKVVEWAIRQMTEDYTVGDLRALLKREGWNMPSAAISVVLTRLKGRGLIEEIRRGYGRTPALFRKPASAISPELPTAATTAEAEPTSQSPTAE